MIDASKPLVALAIPFWLASCAELPYFNIPRDAAVAALETQRSWDKEVVSGITRTELVDEGVIGLEPWGWGERRPITEFTATDTTSTKGSYLEFLHLSDAQVRDSKIIRRSNYTFYDQFAPLSSTLRYELIEDIDSILLATILRGYRQRIKTYAPERQEGVFAIHTGDLVDISMVTEMIDAAAAVRYATVAQPSKAEHLPTLPFISVPGNHDGLTFGVIDDHNSKTWELGINRLEFQLASMLLLDDLQPGTKPTHNEAVELLLDKKTFLYHRRRYFLRG